MIISFILMTLMFDSRVCCWEKLNSSHSYELKGKLTIQDGYPMDLRELLGITGVPPQDFRNGYKQIFQSCSNQIL